MITRILACIFIWSFLIGGIALMIVGLVWALRSMITAMRRETEPLFRFEKEERQCKE